MNTLFSPFRDVAVHRLAELIEDLQEADPMLGVGISDERYSYDITVGSRAVYVPKKTAAPSATLEELIQVLNDLFIRVLCRIQERQWLREVQQSRVDRMFTVMVLHTPLESSEGSTRYAFTADAAHLESIATFRAYLQACKHEASKTDGQDA